MADIFACPKCGEGLTGPVDAKNDTVCPNCRRRWLEDSDRRWAALAIIVSAIISAIIRVAWP